MSGKSSSSSAGGCGGIGIGTIIAVLLSWEANHSILWCIIHGLLGWFYVIYYLLCK